MSAERFYSRCGAPAGGHHCDRPLKVPASLDPPRFCTNCGGRLTVQIFPDGFSSRCLRCERRACHAEHTLIRSTQGEWNG